MTGSGHRRARHLRRRLADPGRPEGLDRRRGQQPTGTSTCTSAPRPTRSTWPRHHDRRPLRRHVRRRHEGLLHDPRQTRSRPTPTPAPTSTRPTSTGAGPVTPKLVSVGTRRAGNTDACTPCRRSRPNWNAVSGAGQLRRGRPRRRRRRGVGDGTVYFLCPEILDGAATAPPTSRTSSSPGPGRPPQFVATLERDGEADRSRDALNDNEVHRYEDFQVTPNGRFALLSLDAAADEGFDNGGLSESTATTPPAMTLACASCVPTEGAPTGGRDAADPRAQASPTTGGSSSTRRPAGAARHERKEDAYEWKEGDDLADLDRVQRLRRRPARGHRRRQGRLLLHPRDARRRRTKTASR